MASGTFCVLGLLTGRPAYPLMAIDAPEEIYLQAAARVRFVTDGEPLPAGAIGVDSAIAGVAIDLSHWQDCTAASRDCWRYRL